MNQASGSWIESCPLRTYKDVIQLMCLPCPKKCLTCDETEKFLSCPNKRIPRP